MFLVGGRPETRQRLEDCIPYAELAPAGEAHEDRVPIAVSLGHVAPRRASAQNPQNAVGRSPLVQDGGTTFAPIRQQWIENAPFRVRQIAPTQGCLLQKGSLESKLDSSVKNRQHALMSPTARQANSYARRAPVKEPYDTVLIACEGMKTEPGYLEGAKKSYRLSSINIRIVQAPGSDPMTIITYAENELKKHGYDRVFCVFDRDNHANFDSAIRKLQQSEAGKANKLSAIVSTPCFEIWVLLHFTYTTKAFTVSGNRSSCENVIREIQSHFQGYAKNRANLFDDLSGNMDEAMKRALQLESHNKSTGSDNPATGMHTLIDYLRKLDHDECN
jgi:RloB-like protein